MRPWIAIVGTRDSGKSHVLGCIAQQCASRGLRLGGVFQVSCAEKGYDIVDIPTGRRVPLARAHHERKSDLQMCGWSFCTENFETAAKWTRHSPWDLTLVELGRLEAAEQGHLEYCT